MKLNPPFRSIRRVKVLVLDTYGVYSGAKIESAHLKSACAYEIEGESGEWVRLSRRWRFLYNKESLTFAFSSHFGEHPFVCLRDGRAISPSSLIPFALRFDRLLKEIAEAASKQNNVGDGKGKSTSEAPRAPEKRRKKKSFPCPVCRHELQTAPPLVCPNCNTGIPADAKDTSSLHWPEHKNASPDSSEGNDGRHIADC